MVTNPPKCQPRWSQAAAGGSRLRIRTLEEAVGGVGGDLTDVRSLGSMHLGLTVGDVAGHGADAAPYADRVRNVLEHLEEPHRNSGEWIRSLNGRLNSAMDDDRFCATISARFSSSISDETVGLSLVNAGLPAPLVYRAATRHVERIGNHGVPLGIFHDPDMMPSATVGKLNPGDILVVYTDGLIEAHARDLKLFGERRVARIVRDHGSRGGQAVLDAISDALTKFLGRSPKLDDLTVATIEVVDSTFGSQLPTAA